MQNEVLVVTGPTASGKTALSVELAEALNGEVVSADSMQIYQYMDIGTAKPTPEEMAGIPHHMLGVVSPFQSYSAAAYVEDASKLVDDILARGKLPIIAGGTGLYIESLIMGRTFAPREDTSGLREELNRQYDELGGEAMLGILRKTDPERAEKLHPNDKKRVVRALEIAHAGENMSRHDEESRARPPKYRAKYIVLGFEERQHLYDRIDRRVDKMLAEGLLWEVENLLEMGLTPEHTAMQAIGYKEFVSALSGQCTIEEAAEKVKMGSRRYAKRQISWCNRYEGALRINFTEPPDLKRAVELSTGYFRGEM